MAVNDTTTVIPLSPALRQKEAELRKTVEAAPVPAKPWSAQVRPDKAKRKSASAAERLMAARAYRKLKEIKYSDDPAANRVFMEKQLKDFREALGLMYRGKGWTEDELLKALPEKERAAVKAQLEDKNLPVERKMKVFWDQLTPQQKFSTVGRSVAITPFAMASMGLLFAKSALDLTKETVVDGILGGLQWFVDTWSSNGRAGFMLLAVAFIKGAVNLGFSITSQILEIAADLLSFGEYHHLVEEETVFNPSAHGKEVDVETQKQKEDKLENGFTKSEADFDAIDAVDFAQRDAAAGR